MQDTFFPRIQTSTRDVLDTGRQLTCEGWEHAILPNSYMHTVSLVRFRMVMAPDDLQPGRIRPFGFPRL